MKFILKSPITPICTSKYDYCLHVMLREYIFRELLFLKLAISDKFINSEHLIIIMQFLRFSKKF